ncbi:potassium/proton antiporter [Lagierella sp.]|uniref:potassium/proton antiporter n=1 Tax=Lagierella sp. TaxID=2849657 RepID=UPI00260A1CEA|nr:potassium/proton antiporter [Lagierella sp.]
MNLLIITLVLLLALLGHRFSDRVGLPSLLLFILLGMSFNFLGYNFSDFELSDKIAKVSLMIIMFYGGFGTNWTMAKPVSKPAIVLSSLGVVVTALLTGAFCYFFLNFDLYEAMLLGSVVGSTDYASVSSILVSKNLNLKYNTAPFLELESGSNDPAAYTMTMVFLTIIAGQEISVPLLIFKQVIFGIGLGFLIGFFLLKIVNMNHLRDDGLLVVLFAAIMFGTFSLTELMGGNGYLALYILGIYIGNKQFHGKRDIVFFYDGLSSLVQIGLFFLLGFLSNIDILLKVLPISLIIMIAMALVIRPLTVFGLMIPFKLDKKQLGIISLAGLRGAAAIAFAIMVVNSKVDISIDIFHIVFGICLFSSFIQGSLMPIGTRVLSMLEPNDTVLKTFNYYQDKSDLGFIQTEIKPGNRWIGRRIKDLTHTFNIIVAKIERDNKTLVAKGNTVIKEGDIVVLGGETHFDKTGHDLTEITLAKNHPWSNKKVSEIKMKDTELIIMLQRKEGGVIVPTGDTILHPEDKIVIIRE